MVYSPISANSVKHLPIFAENCEQFGFGTPKIELFFIANSTKK